MMDWILIALGAGLGSVLRFEIGHKMALRHTKLKIWATFGVNMVGAFLLGATIGMSIDGLWWNFLAEGFLGGFTTFSTFMVEGVQLIRSNKIANAIVYFMATLALGIPAYLLGCGIV